MSPPMSLLRRRLVQLVGPELTSLTGLLAPSRRPDWGLQRAAETTFLHSEKRFL